MADGRDPVDPQGLRGRDLIGLGGFLAGSVVGLTALGYVVDLLADTAPAFTLVGIALGIVAGAVGFWLRVRTALRAPGPQDSGRRDADSS